MNFIEDLKRKVFCRLGVSTIHGVGVFAIRPIPKGINPMEETRTTIFITRSASEILDNPDISDSVKKLVKDLCPQNGDKFDTPDHSLNACGIAWYLNHSETPNMIENDGDFYTMREIQEGEELTVNYAAYCTDLNL